MVDSFMLMQLLRLLKSGDNKSVSHINWWIGDFVEVLDESLGGFSEVGLVPYFFVSLVKLVLYLGHAAAFKIPKVVVEAGFNFDQVWKRANNCILSKEAFYLFFYWCIINFRCEGGFLGLGFKMIHIVMGLKLPNRKINKKLPY